jgi:hypothetical protein
MKPKRRTDEPRNPTRPVFPAESYRLEARQEPPPQRAVAQRRSATAVNAAAVARAVQTSPSYFSHALSRWSALWGGSFYDLIAVAQRFHSIPSLAVLEISISRQLNLETDGASGGLEGR